MSFDPFPALVISGEQIARTPNYRWDNATRQDSGFYAVQRTLSGSLFFEMQGSRKLVRADEAVIFFQNEQSVYGFPPEATEPYRGQFITFVGAGMSPFFDVVRQQFGSIVRMDRKGEAAIIFEEMLRRNKQQTFRDRLQVAEALYRLLLAIYREQITATKKEDPIEYGYHLLQGDVGSTLGLKEITVRIGVSREHFSRQYKQRYGETPGAALRRLRMIRARTLLATGQLSLQAVATACGYSNTNSLQRSLRQHREIHG